MNSFFLKTIVEALPHPAIILEPGFNISCANAPARKLFGEDLAGLDFIRILRQPDAVNCLNQAVETGKLVTSTLVLRLQTPRTYKASAATLSTQDNNGNETKKRAILFTLIDISAEIDAEKSRSTFVANVSHELRSPLTSLMGIVETLKGPARDDEKARDRFLNLMQDETGRMSRLVGDLLSLSKLEAKEHLAPEGSVDVRRLIRHVTTVLVESKDAYKNRVQIDAPKDLPPVTADPDELTEVFQNLIENALKYSTPETPVHIELTHRPPGSTGSGNRGRVCVRIRDQGEGIAPKHLPRLTERFYRADKGRSRDMGGTGLGLAITKHILNRHRATLAIDSVLGEGTIVTVMLVV